MMTRTKRVISGILWMARGTATIMGLAVMLALTVGLASTALAGTGIGSRFDLGKLNTVNDATTQLVGAVAGPMLTVTNNSDGKVVVGNERLAASSPGQPPTSPGPGPIPTPVSNKPAPALGLTVRPGQPPLTVNTGAGTASNLSADRLDGRDSTVFASGTNGKANDANLLDGKDSTAFFSGETYQNSNGLFAQPPGDQIHSVSAKCDSGDVAIGGSHGFIGTASVVDMGSGTTREAYFVSFKGSNQVALQVTCADFPPLR